MKTQEEINELNSLFNDLIRFCRHSQGKEDRRLIKKALDVAFQAHLGVKRKSGEPYIFHPLAVAKIIGSEMGLGTTSIVASLLHDVVEDNEEFTIEDIENLFGEKVAGIVRGLTKISDPEVDHVTQQAETFRKMILSMSDDVRVIFIKLADRLHNMLTLGSMAPNRQMVIAGETLYVYAPIAQRLGLYGIKVKLEDMSFMYRHPKEYHNLMAMAKALENKHAENFQALTRPIQNKLQQEKIEFNIEAKTKSLYSTWKKMVTENCSFRDIHNFMTIRIIFENKPDMAERYMCYLIYAMITELFPVSHESVRDWITIPKSTGFRALVFDVMGPMGEWMEVQIMSEQMNKISEMGEMNDFEGTDISQKDNELYKWIRTIAEHLKDSKSNSLDILDLITLDLFSSEIYVFTPNGKIIKLPKGATVLDFAFYVHSEIGYHCHAATVNRKPTPRNYILKSTDQIEIVTSQQQKPESDWLNYVVTARAKSKLKNYFKKERNDLVEAGKKSLKKIFDDHDIPCEDKNVNELVSKTGSENQEELYYRVGRESITTEQIIKDLRGKTGLFSNLFSSKTALIPELQTPNTFDPRKPFVIDEDQEVQYTIAPCCKPVPNDNARAYKTSNNAIVIHQTMCPESMSLDSTFGRKVARVKWLNHKRKLFLARISIGGLDRMNMLGDISNVISQELKVNMRSVTITAKDTIFEGSIDLSVHNVNDLNQLISKLRRIKDMRYVVRVNKFTDASN